MNGKPRVRSISYSARFLRRATKLPAHIVEKAKKRERLFRLNPFHPLLETHKLHGEKRETWALSVTFSYRITFLFLEQGAVLFLDIGMHDEVYR